MVTAVLHCSYHLVNPPPPFMCSVRSCCFHCQPPHLLVIDGCKSSVNHPYLGGMGCREIARWDVLQYPIDFGTWDNLSEIDSSNINALTRAFVHSILEITAKLSTVRTAQNNAPRRLYVCRMPLTDADAPARALSISVFFIATTYS